MVQDDLKGPAYASKAYADRMKEQAADSETASTPSDEFPKSKGGGWYELSNGESVQGKEDAEKEEAKLH